MAEGGRGKKMMVTIDESECSHYALEWLVDNLRESIAPPLVVFTAQPLSDLSYIYAATYDAAPPELIRFVQEYQKLKISAPVEGIIAHTITGVGDPKDAICDAVKKVNTDLLVVGNHGRGILKRAFLENVSNYCVRNAKCPTRWSLQVHCPKKKGGPCKFATLVLVV